MFTPVEQETMSDWFFLLMGLSAGSQSSCWELPRREADSSSRRAER